MKVEKIGFLCVTLHTVMRRTLLFALTLITLPMSTMAQLIPLLPEGSKNELWLDLDRIYDYNQYEKSRWGLGLQYDINFDTTSSKPSFKTLSLGGYGAYGYADQRFKWGVKACLVGSSKWHPINYIGFFHDITPAVSRTLAASRSLSILTLPASFMTRLFSDTYRITLGHSRILSRKFSGCVELNLSREHELFDEMRKYDFAELNLYLEHRSGWSGLVTMGVSDNDAARRNPFLRVLMQYDRSFLLSFLKINLFAQSGFVDSRGETPYSRLFDLGGSWGCPLALNRTLLTARPNEFTTNLFTMVNLKLTTQEPLIDLYNNFLAFGTAPQPFVLCDGAWGKSFGNLYPAPTQGIAEVGAGIDGLLVWGLVYWGVGGVYRLTPSSSPYHLTSHSDNMTILLTARIDL